MFFNIFFNLISTKKKELKTSLKILYSLIVEEKGTDFESKYELYKKEVLLYLRTDEELYDILLTPTLKSFEFILNRDISIFFKPYTLLSIDIIKQKVLKAKNFFDFFYNHLDKILNYNTIIIPMIRFFLFMGYTRRIFTLFIEFSKKRKKNQFLTLICYFLSEESEEFLKYNHYLLQLHHIDITNTNNSDNIFFYYFKKYFDIKKDKIYLSDQLKWNYDFLSKKFSDYNKILLNNWILLNFISTGNISAAFQFFSMTKKIKEIQFIEEYIESWTLKLGLILMKHNKFNALKYLKHKDFNFFSREEFWDKFSFLYIGLDEEYQLTNEQIFHLFFEYDFFSYYQLLHVNYEEIMLTGLYWYKENNTINLETDKFFKEIEQFQKQIKEDMFFSKEFLYNGFNINDDKTFYKKLVYFLFYKYRKYVLFYAGFDPVFRSLIGFLYENYKPVIALNLYKGISHPLLYFRLNQFYQIYPDSDIIKYNFIKKKNEIYKIYNT